MASQDHRMIRQAGCLRTAQAGKPVFRRGGGFTLLELLITIGLIALLAGLGFPLVRRMQESGRATGCLSNLRQLGAALNVYLGEHEATLPGCEAGRKSRSEEVEVIDTVLAPYVPTPSTFACPADHKHFAESGTSYIWNSVLKNQRVANLRFFFIEDQSRIPLLSDKDPYHPYLEDKVNILYADGHATVELKFWVREEIEGQRAGR